MIFQPSYILRRGKHKGYSLAEVYQYDPTYIDWMVEFIQEFEIDINKFYGLPSPTVFVPPPLPPDYKTKAFNEIVKSFYKPNLLSSVGVLKQSKDLQTIDFKFLDKTIKVLAEKKEGTYTAPEWERPSVGKAFTLEDLECLDQ